MVEKNKGMTNSRASESRAANPQASRNLKAPVAGKTDDPGERPGCKQLAAFEAAMRLFHARRFTEARVAFQQAVAGGERDVAQRAHVHIAMCDRRLEHATVTFATAEEYYNYGVALINARNPGEARVHLDKALGIAPGSDHIYYALALAQAHSGDLAGAVESLRQAIELQPRNRMVARQDADFAPLAGYPGFRALLAGEKKSW
jgi:tetratricopeptide (TPR) repeat protein